MTSITVLESAQLDFDEIKAGFQQTHTRRAFEDFKKAFKRLFQTLKAYPESGHVLDEARAMGVDFRQVVCENIRVIYSYDSARDMLVIAMFLPTQRDFLTHLTRRILRPPILNNKAR